MKPNDLERLSGLQLREYAGDMYALTGADRRLYEKLIQVPIEVKVIAERGVCEDRLYDICLRAGGRWTFVELRRYVMQELSRTHDVSENSGWILLSVLFDGIYVGDPEDLQHHRNGNKSKILYPIKGLGEKLAEVALEAHK
jgi:hypothetical protein